MLKKIKNALNGNLINFIEIVLFLTIALRLYDSVVYNGDNMFMLANSKVILESGFPVTDPLSIHENFAYVTPQWLYAMILYAATKLSPSVVSIFGIGATVLLEFFVWKMARQIIGNRSFASDFFLIVMLIPLTLYFRIMRPIVFTAVFGIAEFLILEKYKGKYRPIHYIAIALLSVAQINFHNSLWLVQILVELCFLAEAIFDKLDHREGEKISTYAIMIAITAAAGLINPYGFDYVTYIFRSLISIIPFKECINELRFPTDRFTWSVVISEIAFCLYVTIKKEKFPPLRYFFLSGGFLVMYFMSLRNISLFMTLGQAVPLWCASLIAPKEEKDRIIRYFAAPIAAGLLITAFIFPTVDINTTALGKEQDAYDMMRELEAEGFPKSKRLLTSFNFGSYPEYLGYKSYIDPRAEVFGIANNGVKDVASEYVYFFHEIDPFTEQEDFNRFLDEYDFDYVCMESYPMAYYMLEQSGRFTLVRQRGDTKFYERNREKTE